MKKQRRNKSTETNFDNSGNRSVWQGSKKKEGKRKKREKKSTEPKRGENERGG